MTSTALPSTSTAPPAEGQRLIRPLGEQIIIRTLPPSSVGSIIIPDAAKRISYGSAAKSGRVSDELQYVNRRLFEQMTECLRLLCAGNPIDDSDWEFLRDLHKRADKQLLPKVAPGIPTASGEAMNFVEAEVIAVGPGRRVKGDPDLFLELLDCLQQWYDVSHSAPFSDTCELLERAKTSLHSLVPLSVEPGDRILYHPAVQSFDRKIASELLGLPAEAECYIVNERTSVLAVLERADSETEVRG